MCGSKDEGVHLCVWCLIVPCTPVIYVEVGKSVALTLIFFFFLRVAPVAYGGSQVRGLIKAVAAGLRHSHAGSELRL